MQHFKWCPPTEDHYFDVLAYFGLLIWEQIVDKTDKCHSNSCIVRAKWSNEVRRCRPFMWLGLSGAGWEEKTYIYGYCDKAKTVPVSVIGQKQCWSEWQDKGSASQCDRTKAVLVRMTGQRQCQSEWLDKGSAGQCDRTMAVPVSVTGQRQCWSVWQDKSSASQYNRIKAVLVRMTGQRQCRSVCLFVVGASLSCQWSYPVCQWC